MSAAIQRVDAAGAGLERMAERRRTGREQIRQVAIMTAVGAVAGIIVWVGLSGSIARALPASWSVPERMAAATLNLDRWDAGVRLMQSNNRWVGRRSRWARIWSGRTGLRWKIAGKRRPGRAKGRAAWSWQGWSHRTQPLIKIVSFAR